MIKFSKILLLFISSFTLFGCYTVAWQPGEALPTKDNLKLEQSIFYSVKDFGVFSDYYNSPWLLNPDNDFLKDNLTALHDLNYLQIQIDIIPILVSSLPVGQPVIGINPPIKKVNTTTIKNSSPSRKIRSNKDKIRNNNGGRKTTKGRSR